MVGECIVLVFNVCILTRVPYVLLILISREFWLTLYCTFCVTSSLYTIIGKQEMHDCFIGLPNGSYYRKPILFSLNCTLKDACRQFPKVNQPTDMVASHIREHTLTYSRALIHNHTFIVRDERSKKYQYTLYCIAYHDIHGL